MNNTNRAFVPKLLNCLEISGEYNAPDGFVFWLSTLKIHLKISEYTEQRIKSLRREKYKKLFQS